MSERNLGVAYQIAKRNSGKQYAQPQEFEAEVDHKAEYDRLLAEAMEHRKHFADDEAEPVEEPAAEPAGAPEPGQDRKGMISSILSKRKAQP